MNASGEEQGARKGNEETHSFDSSCSSTLRFLCTYRRARRGCHRIARGTGGRKRKVRGGEERREDERRDKDVGLNRLIPLSVLVCLAV